jgi:hypothetical protein
MTARITSLPAALGLGALASPAFSTVRNLLGTAALRRALAPFTAQGCQTDRADSGDESDGAVAP